eukprot:CAMPEP_0115308462 /NCGR_PEP_ID=MMETSP0270-20121206/73714_1 /TAXON_ID=71861 /ORGANISM="Scrippsiella trochoidea, Strain CCMP3099" /LENGTH=196 /DNA_ID=CAMNT_0002727027 /DNA_START=24 /DNA_END=614 /DNA_ORIENTATION=+
MDLATMGMHLRMSGGSLEDRLDAASRAIIRRALTEASLLAPEGEKVELDEVDIKGEAIAHCRKGKVVPCFDYQISMPMRIRLNTGELVTGQIEVPEFTNSYGGVSDDFEVRVPFVRDWHCDPATAKRMHPFLLKETSTGIRNALLSCVADLEKAHESAAVPPQGGTLSRLQEIAALESKLAQPPFNRGTPVELRQM